MQKTVLWIRPDPANDHALRQALFPQGLHLLTQDGPADLPEHAGRELVAVILDARFLKDLPFVRQWFKADGRRRPLLVQGHDQQLETHLEALRQGATAYLPPPLNGPALARRLEDLLATGASSPPIQVLVVDDDPMQASFAASILAMVGIEARTATESLKVLETLETCKPDLILMDVYMPDASGVELATVIRGNPEFMDIPIVYLSAEQDPDKQLDALSVGGEDFLTKPIRPKRLLATVHNRIARARQLRGRRGVPGQEGASDPAQVRREVVALLERVRRSPRPSGRATGLLYLEIDSPILILERINLDGIDELMSGLQEQTLGLMENGDQVIRFGDFCMLIIAQRPGEQELLRLAHDLRKRMGNKYLTIRGEMLRPSVSIGLRLLEAEQADANRLINDAIHACHEGRGRNEGVSPHRPVADGATVDETDSALLERVNETENLRLFFQPIVSLRGNQESLYQCLLRLRAANGTLLPAADFLPTVEQSGRILKLDRWVILKGLTLLRATASGADQQSPLRLMVGQATSALQDTSRIKWIGESLTRLGIGGQGLVLEFRFPEIIRDPDQALKYLKGLRQLGLGLSLNVTRDLEALTDMLEHLPVDYLKLSQAQIKEDAERWTTLVKAAHGRGMRVIVSRIEQPELLGQLWAHQVDLIQGNFIQHPGEELSYDFAGAVLG